jgi:hypothetical protein
MASGRAEVESSQFKAKQAMPKERALVREALFHRNTLPFCAASRYPGFSASTAPI